jgi:4-amino-4-deoxy-L-arabinose transferase-like glycosyltransferase
MNAPKKVFEFLIVGTVISAFVVVAAQRLGTAPVPETDESFTLQVPYEMLNRGQLSLPMYRYLGGNIENVWHSYTPVYFLLLGGFLKIFGFGLLPGRAFNLITAAFTLLMVYLLGRKLVDWRAGLIGMVMLVSDQTFLERSRLLRNDYAAAGLAMLGFYLYEEAEERNSAKLFVAAGLTVGAAVMCHTNILYMLPGIGLLMLLRHGWAIFRDKRLYQFGVSAFAVMSYEIVYDLLDLRNFILQNRNDDLHFGLLNRGGWWTNLVGEGERFKAWYAGGRMFLNVPRTTVHIFQVLTAVAIIYLIGVAYLRVRDRTFAKEPRVHLLVITVTCVLFHAVIISHKEIYYVAHLVPWFAICVGAMLSDIVGQTGHIKREPGSSGRVIYGAASAALMLGAIAFGYLLVRQNRAYLREVRNPDLASFDEISSVLRTVVPEGVCPVALRTPVIWLAFPGDDRCFATIEPRMKEALDLSGKEYALIRRKGPREELRELDESYRLLGDLKDTAYGNLRVYYTGTNPSLLSLPPRKYTFFREKRGYICETE